MKRDNCKVLNTKISEFLFILLRVSEKVYTC